MDDRRYNIEEGATPSPITEGRKDLDSQSNVSREQTDHHNGKSDTLNFGMALLDTQR